jgi:hypothetical protein
VKIQNYKIFKSKTKKGVLTKPESDESLTSLWGRLCPFIKKPAFGLFDINYYQAIVVPTFFGFPPSRE